MSRDALVNVINRTVRYGALVAQFKKEPDEVLRGADLTAREIEALKSGDAKKLVAAGVSQAMADRWVRNLGFQA